MSYIWNFYDGEENKRAVFSPLNGEEPNFDPKKWNNKSQIKKTHNCYAYAFDYMNRSFKSKPQPGYYSGFHHMSDNDIRSCDKLMMRVKSDIPSVIPSTFSKKCPKGYRKIYAAVDSSNNPDYHFYRLDKNGVWSHKPGSTNARIDDSNGKIIIRPDKSKRQGTAHTYDRSCGYYCYNPKDKHKRISNSVINRKKKKDSQNS